MPKPTRHRSPTRQEEESLWANGFKTIGGIDEVGRGSLAGPLIASAVVLPPDDMPPWQKQIRDSKALPASIRGLLARSLREYALAIGIGSASPSEIDELGIRAANQMAMDRAILDLPTRPDFLLVDGVEFSNSEHPYKNIVRGDASCLVIAAASIIAKVTRDELLEDLARKHPGYGFERHKGYPTKLHIDRLRALGPSPIHRKSFKPVTQAIKGQ